MTQYVISTDDTSIEESKSDDEIGSQTLSAIDCTRNVNLNTIMPVSNLSIPIYTIMQTDTDAAVIEFSPWYDEYDGQGFVDFSQFVSPIWIEVEPDCVSISL